MKYYFKYFHKFNENNMLCLNPLCDKMRQKDSASFYHYLFYDNCMQEKSASFYHKYMKKWTIL